MVRPTLSRLSTNLPEPARDTMRCCCVLYIADVTVFFVEKIETEAKNISGWYKSGFFWRFTGYCFQIAVRNLDIKYYYWFCLNGVFIYFIEYFVGSPFPALRLRDKRKKKLRNKNNIITISLVKYFTIYFAENSEIIK